MTERTSVPCRSTSGTWNQRRGGSFGEGMVGGGVTRDSCRDAGRAEGGRRGWAGGAMTPRG
eukprot:scaffold4217_cov27-Tisochrysis_lutea.AAC.6